MPQADTARVRNLIAAISECLLNYPDPYTVSELLSAEITLFTRTAEVAIEREPLAVDGIVRLLQYAQLVVVPVPEKVH